MSQATITHTPLAAATTATDDIQGRLLSAKAAYTTRFLYSALRSKPTEFSLNTDTTSTPTSGDIVLARVTSIGQHKRLESPYSRRQILHVGDEVLVAYGNRYAPDQFEAFVPEDLSATHLVAAGGMAGTVASKHANISAATTLEPIGLVTRKNRRVNLTDFAPFNTGDQLTANTTSNPTVMLVFGSSMNSGKSATVAHLVKGLSRAGLRVAAGKATGTGSGNDPHSFHDAGAETVLDFTDFGYASTFALPYEDIKSILTGLHAALANTAPDVIVIEVADGLFMPETAKLTTDADVQALTHRVLYASVDALGASAGAASLVAAGLDVAAVTGVLTASPLAAREAAAALPVDVINTFDLAQPHIAHDVVFPCR